MMYLQNDSTSVLADFTFAVDTCMHFKEYTGNDNCQPDSVVESILSELIVNTKVSTSFFSAGTYVSDNHELSTTFATKNTPLSA